jgi:hypothetical protein
LFCFILLHLKTKQKKVAMEKYKKLKKIGIGAHGVVFKAKLRKSYVMNDKGDVVHVDDAAAAAAAAAAVAAAAGGGGGAMCITPHGSVKRKHDDDDAKGDNNDRLRSKRPTFASPQPGDGLRYVDTLMVLLLFILALGTLIPGTLIL